MPPSDLPPLPILNQPPSPLPRHSTERYGALYPLAIAGLVFLVAWITWFAYRAWSLRDVWSAIAVAHDPSRSELERLDAAHFLGRDPRLNQRQRWDMALHKDLPAPARYLIASGLTEEAIAGDSSSYATSVAHSAGWPDWLRFLLLRPLAYTAEPAAGLPRAPLEALRDHEDDAIHLFGLYIMAAGLDDEVAKDALQQASQDGEPSHELAARLLRALTSTGAERVARLDEATAWVRDRHPPVVALWRGLREHNGHFERVHPK